MENRDGDDRNLRNYISGDLFCGCPLSDRVVPIINCPDLDSVMAATGYGWLRIVTRYRRH